MATYDNENEYKIKHQQILPVIMILASIFILGTSFVIGFSLNTITGVVILVISILMLNNPVAIITRNDILVKNSLGMTLKTLPYRPEEINFRNNNLYINDKKVLSSFNAAIKQDEILAFVKQY